MKTSQLAAVSAAVLAVGTLVSSRAHSQTTSTPVGSLTAFPTVVQTGTKPTLTWNINYPSIVEDYVTVVTSPPAETSSITPKETLICDIRVLGAGVTSQNSNGSIKYYFTRGRIGIGNTPSSWSTIWDGRNTDTEVKQQAIIKANYKVYANKKIQFGGQYEKNDSSSGDNWHTFFSSVSGKNVRFLVSGQQCPTNVPDYNAPSLESFLKPYLDASNRVKIGPMDVIVIMELTHTDETDIGYDLQDLVFLVTFRKP